MPSTSLCNYFNIEHSPNDLPAQVFFVRHRTLLRYMNYTFKEVPLCRGEEDNVLEAALAEFWTFPDR